MTRGESAYIPRCGTSNPDENGFPPFSVLGVFFTALSPNSFLLKPFAFYL